MGLAATSRLLVVAHPTTGAVAAKHCCDLRPEGIARIGHFDLAGTETRPYALAVVERGCERRLAVGVDAGDGGDPRVSFCYR
jgi:hypothetical protein